MHERSGDRSADRSLATAGKGELLRYRSDIDGLRAIAILPILLLHCGVSLLRGGFVGVDIFFVISGYLITSILTRDIAAGHFSILRFYRHRIVRILPALLVMLTIVLVVGCRIFLPNQIIDLGRSTAATGLFASNIYFYLTSDYFAQASDAKPLIHTWSLAVEEQFYLLYPILLIALRGLSRRHLAMVIGALALLSLAIGAGLAIRIPSAGFFLLPARIWELSLGALVALGVAPAIGSAKLRAALCLGALAVIAMSCVAINSGWPFPVPFAIPPAVSAAILIAYGADGPSARLLSLPPLRAVGFISYSLYLWHRPIIALYENAQGETFSRLATIILILVSLAVATASYLLVERPAIRRWRADASLRPHAAALTALACTVAIGLFVASNADRIRPLPPEQTKIASYLGYDGTTEGRVQFGTDRCFTLPTGQPYDPACLRLSPTKRNILLIGDSHAAHLSQALRESLAGDAVLQATAAGCRPLLHGKGLAACRAIMDQAFQKTDLSRVDSVILSGRWLSFEEPQLLETIAYLRAKGSRVIVVGPSVEYRLEMPILLVRMLQTGNKTLADRFRLADRVALDRHMAPLIRSAGAVYVSEIDAECPGGRCRLLTTDAAPYHFDHSHLTESAAHEIAVPIANAVERRRLIRR